MLSKTTMPECYHELMKAPSITKRYCAVCGASWPLNQHHIVWRSWGELYDVHGRKLKKPTVTLCGSGNTGGCHGKAHARHIHFRWVERDFLPAKGNINMNNSVMVMGTKGGHLEFLETEETDYLKALEMDGWKRLR